MNIRRIFKTHILMIICLVFVIVSIASARTLPEIKQSMAKRAPVINTLKFEGIVGENNKGYLAFVGSKRAEEAVVAAENYDRKIVYKYLAKKQNQSLAVAEKNQAARKVKHAKPGEYFQNASGAWQKK